MTRVAAVDIGTNTTRLLVADVSSSGGRTHVERRHHRSIVTRLGQGVDASGELHPEAIDRTVATLAAYRGEIETWGCQRLRAVATSATRDAANRESFLDGAGAALGIRPEVIDGAAEAALSFAGATSVVASPPPYLVIDPGGGSTEFVFGTTTVERVVSVDIGSVRLTERRLPRNPATPQDLAAARHHVDELLARDISEPFAAASTVGVGGTYTALAAIRLDLGAFDDGVVHGSRLVTADLHELADEIATMTLEQIESIPSLDPARAPVLLGGAVVAERALRHVGGDSITISIRDILDGIALSLQ